MFTTHKLPVTEAQLLREANLLLTTFVATHSAHCDCCLCAKYKGPQPHAIWRPIQTASVNLRGAGVRKAR